MEHVKNMLTTLVIVLAVSASVAPSESTKKEIPLDSSAVIQSEDAGTTSRRMKSEKPPDPQPPTEQTQQSSGCE